MWMLPHWQLLTAVTAATEERLLDAAKRGDLPRTN